MNRVTPYNKAIVGGVVPALATIIFYVMAQNGIDLPLEVEAAVITLLTAGLVYLVPNKVN